MELKCSSVRLLVSRYLNQIGGINGGTGELGVADAPHRRAGSQTGERITFFYDLRDADDAWLELNYRQFVRAGVHPEVAQHIPLTFTKPHYGGRRWWMICDGDRVAKVYRPPGANSFGSRRAWRLVYRSQRQSPKDRAMTKGIVC